MRKTLTMIAMALVAASPALAQDTTKKTSDPNKVKCKSHPEIGSLVRMVRECHTAAEWEAMAQGGRSEAQRQMEVMNSSRSGS